MENAEEAMLINQLETEILLDDDLSQFYVAGPGFIRDTSWALQFVPHNHSEIVRVAAKIKRGLPQNTYFSIVGVYIDYGGFSNRGDDEDSYHFHLYIGSRVPPATTNDSHVN